MKHVLIKSIAVKYTYFLIFLLCISFVTNLKAQEIVPNENYKDNVINTTADLLTDYYVFKELGSKAAKHIQNINKKGYFRTCTDLESFASELTKSIYAMTYDKHIQVRLKPKNQTVDNELNKWVNSRMDERNYFRLNNANFKTIRKLHGNIGYLELRGFYGLSWGKNLANYAMGMLATSDAIIIDLRNNYGGRGDMVEYLLSHFFKKPVLTTKITKRQGNKFIETLNYTAEIPGITKMPDVPLFILTSKSTFSAAEGFSYPLKIHKRAIFIGETTGGGANAGDIYSLNNELNIFIPDVSVTHPSKNESWEGVGIEPNIETRSGDALEKAIELAQVAAKKFRIINDKKVRSLLVEFDSIISNFEKNPKNEKIINAYFSCHKQDLIFEEWEINDLGYQMYNLNKRKTAEAVLKSNTLLYPESPYTHNNYAEILNKNGKKKEALLNYKKAIAVALEMSHPDIGRFKKNLQVVEK